MVDGMQDFIEAISDNYVEPSKTYRAEVSSIDNEGTVWVYLNGSNMETPTAVSSSEVSVGDSVNVEWRNNKLYIAGNVSNPSAGVVRVNTVEQVAQVANNLALEASASAETARTAAESAQASAIQARGYATDALAAAQGAQQSADSALVSLSTVEDVVGVLNWITAHGTMTANGSTPLDSSKVYFVRDNNGDYHVGSYYYSIVSEPKAEDRTSYYTLSIDESVQNYVATHIVVDAEGLWIIPDSGGNKVLIATGSGSAYTTAGTYIIGKVNGLDTVFARFTPSGTTMQAANGVQIAHLGYGLGNTDSGSSVEAPYYSFGTREGAIGNYSVAEGKSIYINNDYYPLTASGFASHAEGRGTTASGVSAHAEGTGTIASNESNHAEGNRTIASGITSHAEGYKTEAIGTSSHAEGQETRATSLCCHAEGYKTSAGNYYSHAEGEETKAWNLATHAEGQYTTASGVASHAQNLGTRTNKLAETAIGTYNEYEFGDTSVKGTYAFIIGNGSDDENRSNAFTVDWDGRVNCGDYSGTYKSLFDIFYPVGSYYETSDANFNPNTAWGGTWSLENSGLVHVSAGTGYTIGSTGGSKDAIVPYHNHGFTQPTISNHSHKMTNDTYVVTTSATEGLARANVQSGSNTTYVVRSPGGALNRGSNTTQNTQPTASGGSVGYAGTSGNLTNANMQPYVVVNRWHRTA